MSKKDLEYHHFYYHANLSVPSSSVFFFLSVAICRQCRDHLGKMMVSTSTDSTETALSSPTVVVEPVSVQKRQETFLLVIVV